MDPAAHSNVEFNSHQCLAIYHSAWSGIGLSKLVESAFESLGKCNQFKNLLHQTLSAGTSDSYKLE